MLIDILYLFFKKKSSWYRTSVQESNVSTSLHKQYSSKVPDTLIVGTWMEMHHTFHMILNDFGLSRNILRFQ